MSNATKNTKPTVEDIAGEMLESIPEQTQTTNEKKIDAGNGKIKLGSNGENIIVVELTDEEMADIELKKFSNRVRRFVKDKKKIVIAVGASAAAIAVGAAVFIIKNSNTPTEDVIASDVNTEEFAPEA